MTGTTIDLEERIRFMGIDKDVRQALTDFAPHLEKVLPGVVDGFYEAVGNWPNLMEKFSGPDMIARARGLQIAHWKRVFSGQWDETYKASVLRIGSTHARIGLEPRWYVGGYSGSMSNLARLASDHYKYSAAKRGAVIRALTLAGMLDLELVISIYLKDSEEKAEETRLKALNEERGGVVGIFGTEIAALAQGDVTVRVLKMSSLPTSNSSRTSTRRPKPSAARSATW